MPCRFPAFAGFFYAKVLYLFDERRAGCLFEAAFQTALGDVARDDGAGQRMRVAKMICQPFFGAARRDDERVHGFIMICNQGWCWSL